MENELFSRDPFNWRNAWEWLIENAAFSKESGLEKGQLKVSMRKLAKAWGWEEPRVRRFLSAAENRGMIHVLCRRTSDAPRDAPRDSVADAPGTVITICNYERYQLVPRVADAPADAPRDAPREALPTHSIIQKKESLSYESRQNAPARRAVAESMVEVWKAELGNILSVPTQLTDKRVTSAAVRYHGDFHDNIEEWRAHCMTIRDTPFLVGDNDRQWRADFDWAIRAESVLRVREGKYTRGARAAAPAVAYKRDEDYDGAHKAPWW